MKKNSKVFFLILLLLFVGLACNLPGFDQDDTDVLVVETPPPPPPVTAPPIPEDLPDLIIDDISIQSTSIVLEAEPWTWVTFRVTNIGSAPSPAEFTADMILNGEDPGGYMAVEGGPLPPGKSTTHHFAVGDKSGTWTIGTHTIEVVVDYNNEVLESNDGNNTSNSLTFDIVAP